MPKWGKGSPGERPPEYALSGTIASTVTMKVPVDTMSAVCIYSVSEKSPQYCFAHHCNVFVCIFGNLWQ